MACWEFILVNCGPKNFCNSTPACHSSRRQLSCHVNAGSPAQLVRIMEDDVVVRVEGQPVRCVSDLMRMVGMHPPDSEIDVTLWRTSQRRLETVRIRLGKWPVRDDEGIIETNPRYAPWRGLSVDFQTARQPVYRPPQLEHRSDARRVLVTKVLENSPCHSAHLQPGNFITHVDNVAVQSPAEFYAAVKGAFGHSHTEARRPPAILAGCHACRIDRSRLIVRTPK